MKIKAIYEKPELVRANALALPVSADGGASKSEQTVDRALGGIIAEMRRSGELKGREGEELTLPLNRKFQSKRVLLLGVGQRKNLSAAVLTKYAGLAVRTASRRGFAKLALALPEQMDIPDIDVGEAVATGALMATFDPAPYRSESESKTDLVTTLSVLAPASARTRALQAGIERGMIIGEAANAAREMVNLPANEITPTRLAELAQQLGRQHGLKVDVLDRPQMEKLGMGSFLSVAAGSDEPPKLIVLEYKGDKRSAKTLGLVGKGITFDTGGISLKPALDMDAMKGDMAGGATVIAALAAIARLKPPVNVIGIVTATENMPSGKATKPGDIVRAANGKSIEIINTDAEGRLVLADGLLYAAKLGATHLVDIATLTGAAVIALGKTTTGLMSNDRQLADLFHEAAAPTGERYWELPLFPEYAELLRSDIADIKNSGGRAAGTIYGAMFLKEFVADKPWIHLDIAGTSWTDKESGHLSKGPTAVALRPFVRLAELFATRDLHAQADEAAQRRFADGALSSVLPMADASPRKPRSIHS